jgi:pimeloyl-ACP methyl ester carboxylesterase
MNIAGSQILRVPGAALAYKVRGSGPLLLLISGGEGGAEGFEGLANVLAETYTVVTYDRRGATHSPIDDPREPVRVETHSDDAHRLLEALTAEPALVFGSSSGALVALNLAIRYPDQVLKVVAHEPPVLGLLPEFDQFHEDIDDTYRRGGGAAALMHFLRGLGVTYPAGVQVPSVPQRGLEDLGRRGEMLITYSFRAVQNYQLDLAALQAVSPRLILGGGGAARESLTYRNTAALAERLGMHLAEFPGHHAGYVSDPTGFGRVLRESLERP